MAITCGKTLHGVTLRFLHGKKHAAALEVQLAITFLQRSTDWLMCRSRRALCGGLLLHIQGQTTVSGHIVSSLFCCILSSDNVLCASIYCQEHARVMVKCRLVDDPLDVARGERWLMVVCTSQPDF